MFGPCKVCAEKDKRISSLEDQVAFLRALARPPVNNFIIPDNNLEANGMLDATDQQIQIQTYADATLKLSEEELRERQAILDGSY